MKVHAIIEKHVRISAGGIVLESVLTRPSEARAGVTFAHGSGSSRQSPRNRFVSDVLVRAGFATLLFDLLTPAEDAVYVSRGGRPDLTGDTVSASMFAGFIR